jgi:hypothetical protein
MNGKTSKAKPKMADVTRPKKITSDDTASAPFVIQSRPIIGHASSLSSPSEDEPTNPDMAPSQPETPSAPVLPSQSKRTLIVPISDGMDKADDATKGAVIVPEEPKVTPVADTSKETTETADPKGDAPMKKPDTADTAKDENTDTVEKPAAAAEADDAAPEAEDEKADRKDSKPSAETEKAVAEAAAAAKRERELESLIDSKQFYVPINAVARKREVKHSALMTVCVLLLAIVLVDLMLDSGLILLAEKIPHTHFFTVSNIDQK